jgi:predicted HicB family RNase H-like nuclease
MEVSKKQLGKIGYDAETGMYWGEVIFLCKTELLHAESVEELRLLIRKTVKIKQEESDQTAGINTEHFHENLVICLEPTLHLQLNHQATRVGKSLNEYIVDVLRKVERFCYCRSGSCPR